MYSFITVKKSIDLAKPKSVRGAPINCSSFTEIKPFQEMHQKLFTVNEENAEIP